MFNKETLSLALKLFLITALSALILAFVNKITAPIIAENTIKSFNEAQTEVLPEAKNFTKTDFSDVKLELDGVEVSSLNIGTDADNNCVGYVVSAVCSEGYGGDIEVMVGISPDLKILKAKILAASETPGLGAKASEPKFIDQFNGKGSGLSVAKGSASSDNEIVAISGATITSNAVTKAVNAATALVEKKLEGGMDASEISQAKQEFDKIAEETEKQMAENPDNSGLSTDENKTSADENTENTENAENTQNEENTENKGVEN